ncbi:MAG: pilus assembly protein PilM [Planctomycetota bacterium]
MYPIGLDVGQRSVRLAQCVERNGRLRLAAAASAALPGGDDAALGSAVREALGRGGFSGRRVVSVLPSSAVQSKNLRLPVMPADELDRAVQWEAADRFRMPEGQCVSTYLHAGRVTQGNETRQELIVMAAKRPAVDAHVAALGGAGLRPDAIDAVPTAWGRLLAARAGELGDEDTPRLLIDLGASCAQVLVVAERAVRFYKTMEIGGGVLDAALAGEMGLTLEAAATLRHGLAESGSDDGPDATRARHVLAKPLGELAREIGLCLRYYGVTFRGARPESGWVVGGAACPWTARMLSEATGVPLTAVDPLAELGIAGTESLIPRHEAAAWGVAVGLSVRDRPLPTRNDPGRPEEPEADSVFAAATTHEGSGVAA